MAFAWRYSGNSARFWSDEKRNIQKDAVIIFMQQLNKIFLIVIVVALGALGTAIYFYVQYSGLQDQVTQLIAGKIRVETELALLKATDFAKDNELLKSKLQNTEQDLAGTQSRVKTLETNLNKIKPFLDPISVIERFFSG